MPGTQESPYTLLSVCEEVPSPLVVQEQRNMLADSQTAAIFSGLTGAGTGMAAVVKSIVAAGATADAIACGALSTICCVTAYCFARSANREAAALRAATAQDDVPAAETMAERVVASRQSSRDQSPDRS